MFLVTTTTNTQTICSIAQHFCLQHYSLSSDTQYNGTGNSLFFTLPILISYYVTSLGKPLVVVDNQRDLCYTQDGNLTDHKPNSNPNP